MKFVINYDYPNSSEDYIHRIGRTARSTKTGTAYTFFTPNNIKQVNDLISVLREANQAINPKLLQLVEDRGSGKGCCWSQCIAFLSEQYGNFRIHLQLLSKINVEGGLVSSYCGLRRYKSQKNQHPIAPRLCCGTPMARAGPRGTSYLPWNETHLDSVLWLCILWLGKRNGPTCPAGKVKSHFLPWCHNLVLWGRVYDSSEVRQLFISGVQQAPGKLL